MHCKSLQPLSIHRWKCTVHRLHRFLADVQVMKVIFTNPMNSMSAASLGHEHAQTHCYLKPEIIFRHKIGQVYFLKILLPADMNFYFFLLFSHIAVLEMPFLFLLETSPTAVS